MLTITGGVTFQVLQSEPRVHLSKTNFVILPPRKIPMELLSNGKSYGHMTHVI